AVDRDVDVFTGHVGHFGLQHDLVLAVLENVHGRRPRTRRRQPFVIPAVGVAEDAVDAILQLCELTERVTPTNDSHTISPYVCNGLEGGKAGAGGSSFVPRFPSPSCLSCPFCLIRHFPLSAYSASTTSPSFTSEPVDPRESVEPCEPAEPVDPL